MTATTTIPSFNLSEAALSQLPVLNRQDLHLRPDPTRVIVRPFKPATEPRDLNPTDKTRANHIVERVLGLDTETADRQLADVLENFLGRHRNLLQTFEARAAEMEVALADHAAFTQVQRQLVGAYFLNEYSFEASALFNPSIVAHPDQSGTPEGSLRFILSLRAVGEGHVSSLTFRSGLVAARRDRQHRAYGASCIQPRYCQADIGCRRRRYRVTFAAAEDISERVIFPVTEAQSNGIEDARFVQFSGEQKVYYATYTAYSGRAIRSELIETSDFVSFRLSTLRGSAARNKGMALFPRKIDGKYAMIARQDNENLYLIYSDDLYTWEGGRPILKPEYPWEFVQIGNCGSPIELDEGWLLLTHGVGPVRKYSIGAALLDKKDPSKVLARLARAAIASRSFRPRRIRSERGLYLRRNASSRQDHLSLRGLGHVLQFRDDRDRLLDRGHG